MGQSWGEYRVHRGWVRVGVNIGFSVGLVRVGVNIGSSVGRLGLG